MNNVELAKRLKDDELVTLTMLNIASYRLLVLGDCLAALDKALLDDDLNLAKYI